MTKVKNCFQARKYHAPKKTKAGNKGGMRRRKRKQYAKRVWINELYMIGLFEFTF